MKDIRYSSNIVGNQISMATLLVYITSILFASYGTEAYIGMNWGRQSAQRLVPSQVVDLLLQNGIQNARIYTSEDDVLEAFVDSGINLTISLHKVTSFADIFSARKWVLLKSKYLLRSNIRQVTIGSNPFVQGIKDRSILLNAFASMKNLQDALQEAGHDHVTTNLLNSIDMMKPNIMRPSAAEFRDEIKWRVTLLVRHLRAHNAPFLVEMFSLLDARRNNFNLSFAFIDNKSPKDHAVKDVNGAVYTNVFEFTHDCFVWALIKMNASDIRIVVTQAGWPTDGHVGATAANAERYFKHLLPLVASNKGTPMRPGSPIDIHVHALTDETQMTYADPFTRHWGVYRSNGQPKYRIDLSGRGRNIYPATIGGIMRMPNRWCVFNGNKTDMYNVKLELEKACQKGDCSSTTVGGSCSGLSFDQNVSYAFNMLFQFRFQKEKACDYGGLGRVAVTDPSTGNCVFPVEVVKGQQLNFYMT